jgi:hypothetical protein
VVPCSWLLLQVVEGLVEPAHQLRVCRVNEASGLRAVGHLRECVMEKGVLDVELVHGLILGDSQCQHNSDGGRLDDRVDSFIVVHPEALSEPPEDPMRLVPVKRAIHLKIVLADPLARDDIGPSTLRNQVTHVVGQQGLILLLHRAMLVGVCEHGTDTG